MIPVFLSADNNYAPYLCVVVKSVCENTKSDLNFCILDGGISDYYKSILKNICLQYKNTTIEFINSDSINPYSASHIKTYLPKAALYRLLIPNLKPQFDKALYLDVDSIVNLDVEELFNHDIDDYILGAIYEEYQEKYHSCCTKRKLGIDLKHKYFNSGVLLINCKKWHEDNIAQKLEDIYHKYKSKLFFLDQDLLNILSANNNYYMLDKKYNYLIQNQENNKDEYYNTENPNIICHYDGPIKPWHFLPDLKTEVIPYIDIWWKYAKETDCYNELIDKCIYKDFALIRVARAIKAHQKLRGHKVEQIFEEYERQQV